MTDLGELLRDLRAGAEQRGLPVVDAMFSGEPTFFLRAETTSAGEALDMAQRMPAPFLSIASDTFDADEFIDSLREDAPADLVELAREHHGETSGVMARWLGLGATAALIAGADWADDLEERRLSLADAQRTSWQDTVNNRAIRVAYLSEHIERDPRYRAAGQNQRSVVGELVADELRGADDDATTVRWALEEASKSLRKNAAELYLPLEEQMEQLRAELRETDAWRSARGAKPREEAARAYLLELTGYAPTAALAERLARFANTGF